MSAESIAHYEATIASLRRSLDAAIEECGRQAEHAERAVADAVARGDRLWLDLQSALRALESAEAEKSRLRRQVQQLGEDRPRLVGFDPELWPLPRYVPTSPDPGQVSR